ncbi:MAG: ABC transporter ATP-binding protein [Deltaproteobacteria bacterium]|jgi:branched-chain amino acid transport system ATP-binding protein|nr:ABC transporter ATP-binding protein [Deltaproteobacteria bacterium]MBT4642551.1 ABC transporter ATP-binding protein [Deltaproteobacteria bacterium]
MLVLQNVEVKYSKIILSLRAISLTVRNNQVVALMGANGAGKTTTLKAISGLLTIDEGEVTDGSIEFNGQRIDKKRTDEIVKMGIVQILEGRMVLEQFTAEENLRLGAHTVSVALEKEKLERVYHHFPRLKERRRSKAGYLSGGEQQMLVVGRALMADPKIMLIDEASLGLAPILVQELFGILKSISREENMAILLVEQNVRAALDIADYGYVMENGKIAVDGTAEKLRNNEDIREFYMGLSSSGEKKSYKDIKHYKRRKRWLV